MLSVTKFSSFDEQWYFQLTFKHLNKHNLRKGQSAMYTQIHTRTHSLQWVPVNLYCLTINQTPTSIQPLKHLAGYTANLVWLWLPVEDLSGIRWAKGATELPPLPKEPCPHLIHRMPEVSHSQSKTPEVWSTALQWWHAERGLKEGTQQSRSLRTNTAPRCLLANKCMHSLKEADFKYRNCHCCHFARTKDKNNSTSVSPVLHDLQGRKYQ